MRLLLMITVAAACGTSVLCEDNGPRLMRTELKVGRSLGPTETVTVKTREGGTAELVVAKRTGRRVGDIPPPANPANHPGPRAVWIPPPVDVKSEIYVKNEAKTRARKLELEDGIPVVTGVRVPDSPEDKYHVWRNARVINNVLHDSPVGSSDSQTSSSTSQQAQQQPGQYEWLKMEPIRRPVPTEVRLPDYIQAANKEETNRLRDGRRLAGGEYPGRLLYTSGNAERRVEEGVRTPVLQYAHPELGVQPAKPVEEPVDRQEQNEHFHRDQALAYFAHDIHSDRSPYAFEPGLEEEARLQVFGQRSASGKRNHYPPGPNHIGPYGKYSYKVVMEKPFWEKVKEQMEYGMEQVQSLARPVVEPLVEATHKISENLGLVPGTRHLSEKLGVATSGSVLLPALGLVAGGAALGLGAVAVGRFLDMDLLKRSAGDNIPPELARALKGANQLPRQRRSTEEDLQNVWHPSAQHQPGGEGADWGSTPCAKRVFCNVMLARSDDDRTLMEKKMTTYLNMLHPSMANAVSGHLDEVMAAIRSGDCSVFKCPQDSHRR